MTGITQLPGKWTKVVLIIVLVFTNCTLSGQGEYTYFYRVYFRDKGANVYGNFSASGLLSDRAVSRRLKSGIQVPDYSDLPVFHEYIDQIRALGFTLHCTSKWLNTALFKTKAKADTSVLKNLPFVGNVKIVKKPAGKSGFIDKLDFQTNASDMPPYNRPLTMLGGDLLHSTGYDGNGVIVAILDGGFLNADLISSLSDLRSRKGIICTRDFVNNDHLVYGYHSHGTAVLSVLAGQSTGNIEGTAPGADFILLRTEDVSSEFAVEEDFWAAGAEFADSAGADIISSSLGYYKFDDPLLDYKFSDLDGKTAFVTRAADIAASKGILVVCSAGNERNKEWVRIIAPSDGVGVISAGAVDGNGTIASFSSAGPSADRRVKPDNVAMGVNIAVQTEPNLFSRSNGTSFSCPVLSGMSACLKQAVPEATNTEIINALQMSGDRISVPDTLYGYGIPSMIKALAYLQDIHLKTPENASLSWPNPTTGEIEITFREAPDKLTVEIYSLSGETIYRKDFVDYAGRSLTIQALTGKPQGIYFIRLKTGTGNFVHRIVKLNN